MFEYIIQPPSTTLEDCSPYYQNRIINIVLDCAVRNRTNYSFEIQWFRKNTNGAVEDLGSGEPRLHIKDMVWYSRYHHSDFFNQQYNPSYLGKYWCQVINTTADPDQPLMRSNVFTLLALENYNQHKCPGRGVISVNNSACADLPVHSKKTKLPSPITSLNSVKSSCWKLPDCTTIGKNAETEFW